MTIADHARPGATRLARAVVPARLRPPLRRMAEHAGWVEPEPVGLDGLARDPFVYPFWEAVTRERSTHPHYLWGTLNAAFLARSLGMDRISVIEFGVAGGNGLVALEAIASAVESRSGVAIDTYGFDTGAGLPKPQDHRDLPQLWDEGYFGMDVEALQARLSRAELVLGPVSDTVEAFADAGHAPIGFVVFDMDMYSSTVDAFRLFDADPSRWLPRVVCYFDDMIGFSHSDFGGERLAIDEFNAAHERRKLSQIYGLRYVLGMDAWWVHQMYLFHAFDHPQYNDYDGTSAQVELPLTE